MRYLEECGRHDLDCFKDPAFAEFWGTLDAEMKRIQSLRIGTKRKQAEPLTCEKEMLWQIGQLGDHSPQLLHGGHNGFHEWDIFCIEKWR